MSRDNLIHIFVAEHHAELSELRRDGAPLEAVATKAAELACRHWCGMEEGERFKAMIVVLIVVFGDDQDAVTRLEVEADCLRTLGDMLVGNLPADPAAVPDLESVEHIESIGLLRIWLDALSKHGGQPCLT